ncbi:TRAP transporter large permease [Limnochorda pilosa]|uniref:C4-dicarboxylate ABC transporter permease n=1 Tax=Limnochorda pilosa TaxID=1555112 RepID=A0A0K2SLD9_LIMPI|nr:TRAP transporter large permease [Limnochorda pilosa]BAS27941.1 C4-dicarboxylate ABC transporter permease [Limnochorda pilosa]
MTVLASSFVLLLVLGMPIAFSLGLAGVAYVVTHTSLPVLVAFQRMFTGVDSFPFMAIPFFMLAGALMNAGGLADRIIVLSRALVGHLPGGLANVSIVASMFFAGVSGSSVADASGLGSILIPAMKREKYGSGFSAAVNATSSTVGIIIPPSIPMILTGVATALSIRELFFGGAVPGILAGLSMLALTTVISRRRGYAHYRRATGGELARAILQGLPALFMVVIILGGIMGGIFTPTEASVVAVLYALILGLIYREITWQRLKDALLDSAVSAAVVMMVISTAALITWLLAYSMVPQRLAAALSTVISSPTVLLLILGVAFLVAGTFLDVSPGVILFGPILLPVVQAVGADPIHFAVIMVFALAIGLFTPPVGTTLIISSYLAKVPVLQVARESLPYLVVMVILLFVIIFVDDLALWLPGLLFH